MHTNPEPVSTTDLVVETLMKIDLDLLRAGRFVITDGSKFAAAQAAVGRDTRVVIRRNGETPRDAMLRIVSRDIGAVISGTPLIICEPESSTFILVVYRPCGVVLIPVLGDGSRFGINREPATTENSIEGRTIWQLIYRA